MDKQCVTQMRTGLSQGKSFSEMMASLGFSSAIVTQLSLAEFHGNLHLSLGKIEEYLDNLTKVKKKLIEVATYPLILLGFLLLIMMGLRNYLLPQLDSSNIATQIIGNLPQIFLGLVLVCSLILLLALTFYKRSSKIRVFSILARLPFLGIFVQTYLTAYYAREWGNMISQGMELTQIFQMMQEQGSQLFKEIGQDLAQSLQSGREFSQTIATYPLILLGFLLLIMLGLRNYLLPQLDSSNIATQIIGNLPQIFLGMVGVVSVGVLLALTFYKRSSKMRVFSILARLPFFGIFVQTYLTAYYAREWGNMISQGMELMQIFQIMQEQGSQLFKEIGRDLAQALQNGQEFSQTIATYPFFRKELSLIIEYGEVKSKLGSELEIYAEKTWESFFTRVNRTMNLVQPLVFIFVALIIVLLYAAMLMPMYQNMEVNF